MALGFLNRCGFRATSTGTGSFVVASALTGMQTPAQAAGPAVVNANTYRYFAQSDDNTQWEYGYGVYTTGDVTLTRATILDNSSGGTTALSFSAAPKVFMGGPLAQDMPLLLADTTFSAVTSFSFDLPLTYRYFELEIIELIPSGAEESLMFAFSDDGGSTYIYDDTNFDDYDYFGTPGSSSDSIGTLTGALTESERSYVFSKIDAAATSLNAQVETISVTAATAAPLKFVHTKLVAQTGRVNKMIVMPYGNGDAPPTGTTTISGRYRLWGRPG